MRFYVRIRCQNGPTFKQIKLSQQLLVYNTETNLYLNLSIVSVKHTGWRTCMVNFYVRFIYSAQRLQQSNISAYTFLEMCYMTRTISFSATDTRITFIPKPKLFHRRAWEPCSPRQRSHLVSGGARWRNQRHYTTAQLPSMRMSGTFRCIMHVRTLTQNGTGQNII